ncbi:hypothetical protein DL767_001523 [Monosporascus sp. MG133]|nr:hypothetical protein DL767_001523 [Monosporascus sp. MG133]
MPVTPSNWLLYVPAFSLPYDSLIPRDVWCLHGRRSPPTASWIVGSAALIGVARLAVDRPNKWRPGDTIKIKLLNGTRFLHSMVKQYAPVWVRYANLQMEVVERRDYADVRVAFNRDGHWSEIGTSCVAE